jgi:hypothetical protein
LPSSGRPATRPSLPIAKRSGHNQVIVFISTKSARALLNALWAAEAGTKPVSINRASPKQMLTPLRRHVQNLGYRLLPPNGLIEVDSDFRICEDMRTPTRLLGE